MKKKFIEISENRIWETTSTMKQSKAHINKIDTDPENPNRHSEEKIETLARNIKEFGLINPILVRFTKEKRYQIIAGEGRWRAWRKIWSEAKDGKGWDEIPVMVADPKDEGKALGRQLAENRLRSFSWPSDCQSIARMRGSNYTTKQLAGLFGYNANEMGLVVALGFIPGLEKLLVTRTGDQTSSSDLDSVRTISLEKAKRYLLSLRYWPPSIPKNDKDLDLTQYDYSACTECIDKIVAGEFHDNGHLDDFMISEYVRLVQVKQAERRSKEEIEQLAKKEVESLLLKISDKDKELKKLREDNEKEIERRLKESEEAYLAARAQTKAQYDDAVARLENTMEQLKNKAGAAEELEDEINKVLLEKEMLEGRYLDLENEMTMLREQVRIEVAAEVKQAIELRLREEIQAEVDEDARADIKEQIRMINDERVEVDGKLKRYRNAREKLESLYEKIRQERIQWQEEKARAQNEYSLGEWVVRFNEAGWAFVKMLGYFNDKGLVGVLAKTDAHTMLSVLHANADEMRKINKAFNDAGLINGKK
jgi:ParB/RepB/Spo0J family partition protein